MAGEAWEIKLQHGWVCVTEQDPMGPWGARGGRPWPACSAGAPLWSTWLVVCDAHFLSGFADVNTPPHTLPHRQQMGDVNYLTRAHSPQASWSLRTDDVNPCDTAPLHHRQPIREWCTSWSHTHPTLRLTFKSALPKPFTEFGAFRAWATCLLAWPCSEPFSAPNSDVSVCLASLYVGHTKLH